MGAQGTRPPSLQLSWFRTIITPRPPLRAYVLVSHPLQQPTLLAIKIIRIQQATAYTLRDSLIPRCKSCPYRLVRIGLPSSRIEPLSIRLARRILAKANNRLMYLNFSWFLTALSSYRPALTLPSPSSGRRRYRPLL
jgi:hypothetical protein